MEPPALIVTLQPDAAAQAFFDARRKQYFPAHINHLPAHLTLFHHLPGDQPAVFTALAAAVLRPVFTLEVTGLFHMGNGLAYTLHSAELVQWHQHLQQDLTPWLVQRDQQPLWPHVTIQHKVTAYKATRLQQQLELDFRPFSVQASGLCLWHYRKGSWEAVDTLAFEKKG